jgi:electron transfer flavoprotein alpha/beta subunit
MAAKKKPLEVLDAAGVGLDAAAAASKVKVTAMELPPARPDVAMIEGEPETQAAELIRRLADEAKVI